MTWIEVSMILANISRKGQMSVIIPLNNICACPGYSELLALAKPHIYKGWKVLNISSHGIFPIVMIKNAMLNNMDYNDRESGYAEKELT